MTVYSGEKPYVAQWAKHPITKEQLTGDDVTVVITIWDLDGTVLVDDAPMTFDAALTWEPPPGSSEDPQVGGWYYIWESPADSPGAYRARCTVVEMQAWEYTTVRLRRDKAPAAP